MSVLKQALRDGVFTCVVEFVPKASSQRFAAFEALMAHTCLHEWPLVAAIADRVGGNFDIAPADAYAALKRPVSTLLHFSGKDRERSDLLAQLDRMDGMGVKQLLLISGDRLPGHDPGQRPVRYLESVPALQMARAARPDWLLGAALNPFKYREEEGCAQYLKALKKLSAGADFLTVQLGYDARKHQEALAWMAQQATPRPLLACVMALTHGRAAMLTHVPGVVLSPSMLAVLAAEARVSREHAQSRSVDRLALQIVGLKWMGYAGIHLSGVHSQPELEALEQRIVAWSERIDSLDEWQTAWLASWQMPGQPVVTFNPEGEGWYLGESSVKATTRETLRYHVLSGVHSRLFSHSTWLGKAFGWSVRRPLWSGPSGARWLRQLERSVKRPLVGCDTCGQCRLEDTLYVCPETCPKGLANGPCGGTRLNRCEFGDRECIHSVKYRIGKSVGQIPVLAERLIPCIEEASRHRSSWPRWFDAGSSQCAQAADPQPGRHAERVGVTAANHECD
jgi:methylenetetrahydrofolate reductase (NADPH)